MSIQDLPDELLLLVFKPFADIQRYDDPSECTDTPSDEAKSNLKTLASLSMVCVKWHAMVEPILYSTLRKPGTTYLERPIALPRQNDNAPAPSPDQDDHVRVAQPNQTLKLFLRTIIERPHLARDTKRIVLGSWSRSTSYNDSLFQDAVEASKPEPSLRRNYAKALQRLAVRSRNTADFFSWLGFVSHVLDGYEGSELILLLQLTPNLTTLHLAQIPYIQKWMVTGEHGLASRVTTIRLGSADKLHEVNLFRLRVLVALPNLRTLTFVNCSVLGLPRCPPSNLTHH